MNIYLEPNTKIEDLVNMLEEINPGVVKSRIMLEVTTDDKALALLLIKMAENTNGGSKNAVTGKPHTKAYGKPRGSYAKTNQKTQIGMEETLSTAEAVGDAL